MKSKMAKNAPCIFQGKIAEFWDVDMNKFKKERKADINKLRHTNIVQRMVIGKPPGEEKKAVRYGKNMTWIAWE